MTPQDAYSILHSSEQHSGDDWLYSAKEFMQEQGRPFSEFDDYVVEFVTQWWLG